MFISKLEKGWTKGNWTKSDIKINEIGEKEEKVTTPIELIISTLEKMIVEDFKAQILKKLKEFQP